MPTGTVKKFFAEKGFGFIVPDAGGVDVFVHIRNCAEEVLSEGARVRFDERLDTKRGKLEAFAVALL